VSAKAGKAYVAISHRNRCGICKRRMLPNPPPHWRWVVLRNRINCGGECLQCVTNMAAEDSAREAVQAAIARGEL
jgi:hypothetical protein